MTALTIGLQVSNKESLFESIKHIDENGNEYWVARELMTVLGYKTWQKFKAVIEDATDTVQTLVNNLTDHFIPTVNMVKRSQGGGINQVDYKLSRFASYHIALSCDARGNTAVKLARQYFVVKTREAEIKIPQQNEEIEKLKLQLEIAKVNNESMRLGNTTLRLQKDMIDKAEAFITMHGLPVYSLVIGRPDAVVEVETKITETVVCKNGRNVNFEGSSTAEVGRKYGFKSGTQLVEWLKSINAEHLICQGLRAVQAPYIPKENLEEIKHLWMQNKNRQILLGE